MSGGKGQFIGNPSNHQMCKIVKEGEVYFHFLVKKEVLSSQQNIQ